MATEFDLGAYTYQISKMDAFTQLGVAAKLAPLVVPFAEMVRNEGFLENSADSEASKKSKMMDAMFANFSKIAALVAQMPDNDRDHVLAECLNCVSRTSRGGKGWQHVWNSQSRSPQFEDLTGIDVLQIAARVVMDQLGNFIPGSDSKLSGALPV